MGGHHIRPKSKVDPPKSKVYVSTSFCGVTCKSKIAPKVESSILHRKKWSLVIGVEVESPTLPKTRAKDPRVHCFVGWTLLNTTA